MFQKMNAQRAKNKNVSIQKIAMGSYRLLPITFSVCQSAVKSKHKGVLSAPRSALAPPKVFPQQLRAERPRCHVCPTLALTSLCPSTLRGAIQSNEASCICRTPFLSDRTCPTPPNTTHQTGWPCLACDISSPCLPAPLLLPRGVAHDTPVIISI